MRFFLGLRSLILTLFRKILFLWVRTDVSGNSVEALGVDPEKPVCYVLQYSSLSSRLVLEQEVLRAGLPGAESSLPVKNGPNHSFFFLYRRIGGLFRRRQTPDRPCVAVLGALPGQGKIAGQTAAVRHLVRGWTFAEIPDHHGAWA